MVPDNARGSGVGTGFVPLSSAAGVEADRVLADVVRGAFRVTLAGLPFQLGSVWKSRYVHHDCLGEIQSHLFGK